MKGIMLGTISHQEYNHTLVYYVLYFIYLGIAEFGMVYINTVGFIYTSEHITQKVREPHLEAILRQNIADFDKLGSGEVTTRITANTNLIQDGIWEKVGRTLTVIATFAIAFIIAYIKFWKLALICTSMIGAMVLAMGGGSRFIIEYSKLLLDNVRISC